MPQSQVQGASKEFATQTSMQDQRRRRSSSRQSEVMVAADSSASDRRAMMVFCGIDNVMFEASRSVEAWWSGLTQWTTNLFQGKL